MIPGGGWRVSMLVEGEVNEEPVLGWTEEGPYATDRYGYVEPLRELSNPWVVWHPSQRPRSTLALRTAVLRGSEKEVS